MLMQLYHQYKDGSTSLVDEKDISWISDVEVWVQDQWKENPPPGGSVWLMTVKVPE